MVSVLSAMEKSNVKAHAMLGASSSHRWLNCTPSAMAESVYPDSESDFAREGTLAHALAAKRLKTHFGRSTKDEETEIAELSERYLTGEMEEHVEGYCNFVLQRYREARERARRTHGCEPEIRIEARLDYSDWVEDGFGTGDALIIGGGMMEIIDLKYGKGVEVNAENNTQMMLYALGAGAAYDYAFDISVVRMTIYQPRIGNLSSWEIPADELTRWAREELTPLAMLAAKGKGARQSGEWCRFCRAKGDCPRLAADSLALFELNSDANGIEIHHLPRILAQLDIMKVWVNAVEERALARALGGERIKGYKLVEGRSVRKITDPQGAAAALLAAGAEPDEVWRPRELRTLTELERTFGKKGFAAACGKYVEKPKGKPTLTVESDRRKALDPADTFAYLDLASPNRRQTI